jgi:hypothetical protein
MGSRNPERDRLFGSDGDLLALYIRDYSLSVTCSGLNCTQGRKISVPQALRWFGPEATIRDMRKHLRCSRCGARGPSVTAVYVGKRGGER